MPGPLFWGIAAMSVACVVHYLRATRGRPRRLAWLLAPLVPVVGPLVYGAFHLFPSEQEEGLRAAETDTDGDPND